MNSSDKALLPPTGLPDQGAVETGLASEAGIPFVLPAANTTDVDPIAEWLSLMEVVQMLCPAWPVRDKPMVGDMWRL